MTAAVFASPPGGPAPDPACALPSPAWSAAANNRTEADPTMARPEAPATPSWLLERIAVARAGDEQALEQIIRHYQERIVGYVVSRVGRDAADVQDLCQTIFVKMALALPRLKAAEAFEPWLFTIARNVCRDHLRRRRLRGFFVPLSRDHEAIPAEQPSASEFGADALGEAVEGLPRSQRELIDLLREGEYSYGELARLTKSSVRAVAGRLFRARARLRRFLGYREGSR